ncbi:DUF4097 family beta strand repeat-containing protein [Streptomyces sp. NPDC091265]|uniref:DUF4097 family beta strand repeat-containing protein n=1 Tax=unclassified Streptomyces TaxID=2593676 RepID=UPI00344D5701
MRTTSTCSSNDRRGRTAAAALAGCALVLPLFALTACSHGDGRSGPLADRDRRGAGWAQDGRAQEFRQASLPSGSHLVITTEGGVRVTGSDADTVRVDAGTLAHWDAEGTNRTLDLPCDQGDERARDNCGGMPLVRVPAGVTLTVRARNAGIDVSDVRGALSLSTVNGDVTVQDSGTKGTRDHLVTRNGSVRATGLSARTVGAETVNGDVELLCTTPPDAVDGSTRNGSVRVTLPAQAPAYLQDVSTVNGRSTTNIPTTPGTSHGRLTLRTVNGDTEIHHL